MRWCLILILSRTATSNRSFRRLQHKPFPTSFQRRVNLLPYLLALVSHALSCGICRSFYVTNIFMIVALWCSNIKKTASNPGARCLRTTRSGCSLAPSSRSSLKTRLLSFARKTPCHAGLHTGYSWLYLFIVVVKRQVLHLLRSGLFKQKQLVYVRGKHSR